MQDLIIDLHVHSNKSDGRESIAEIFDEAEAAGLAVLALTDHDTTAGWQEAESLARERGIGFVPGIEVTTRARVKGPDGVSFKISTHMLAYLPNPDDLALQTALAVSIESREIRLREITKRLSADFTIAWDDVLASLPAGATLGRPAVADALVANGHFKDRTEVFEKIFYKGNPYYVPTEGVPDTLDAIELIRQAGGVPVIAHPLARNKNPDQKRPMPEAHFQEMIEAGLGGFEVYHRDVPQDAREWLLLLAEKHGLFVTGSSDYHGKLGKPNLLGEHSTSKQALARIIEQATGTQPYLPEGIL